MAKLVKLYLVAYNSLQAFAWTISLIKILGGVFSTKSISGAYASAGGLICAIQTAAFVEVLHGAMGIVPSGVLSPLMQWGGRTHFVLAIVRQINEVQKLPAVFVTFFTWSLGEVIRYLQYALNCSEACPSWVTYVRYTAFILLYPIGVVGEVWLMYQALPYTKSRNLYKGFFSAFPFSYYDFLRVLLLFYPFLWLRLYLHMFKQRRSKLGHKYQTKKKKI